MENKLTERSTMARLAICAVLAAAAIYAAENLCEGKSYPLWEKYGPWLKENKLQAIAITAALLYAASLALIPDPPTSDPPSPPGFDPC